jgi:hypothetical protein
MGRREGVMILSQETCLFVSKLLYVDIEEGEYVLGEELSQL